MRGNGAVGFASFAVGPTYPIYLDSGGFSNCIYGHQCLYPFNQTVSALADVAGYGSDQAFYSKNLEALSTNLTNSTLLTGYVDSACMPTAPSVACSSSIHTDLGDRNLLNFLRWCRGERCDVHRQLNRNRSFSPYGIAYSSRS